MRFGQLWHRKMWILSTHDGVDIWGLAVVGGGVCGGHLGGVGRDGAGIYLNRAVLGKASGVG